MEQFKIFQWRYVSRKPRATFVVYAREQKTADEIIAIENTDNLYILKPAKVRFCTPTETEEQPYALEQRQLAVAERRLNNRRAYIKAHPVAKEWLAKH